MDYLLSLKGLVQMYKSKQNYKVFKFRSPYQRYLGAVKKILVGEGWGTTRSQAEVYFLRSVEGDTP